MSKQIYELEERLLEYSVRIIETIESRQKNSYKGRGVS
jgi:hypothetical protein